MTDNEILSLISESPSHGQRLLFDKYYSYVYAIVSRIISGFGSNSDSEECVIDVFASVLMKLPTGEKGSLKAYIGTVARNTAISMRRSLAAKTGLNVAMDDDIAAVLPDSANIAEQTEQKTAAEQLLAVIESMGVPDSVLLIQKYYYERSSQEIAELLGMSAGTVRVRCGRAMKRLMKLLDEKDITL